MTPLDWLAAALLLALAGTVGTLLWALLPDDATELGKLFGGRRKR